MRINYDIYISDKQYILDNYTILQFECTDKVGLVRDYLEKDVKLYKRK